MPSDAAGGPLRRPTETLWARWRQLSRAERRATIAAVFVIPIVHASLKVFGANRTTKLFAGKRAAPAAHTAGSKGHAESLARAVSRAARRGVFDGNCLSRSITLLRLLRGTGIDGELRLGARKHEGKFDAHAWVEYQGMPLNDSHTVTQRFAAFKSSSPRIPVPASPSAGLTHVQATLLKCLRAQQDDTGAVLQGLSRADWRTLAAYAGAQAVQPMLLRRIGAPDVRPLVPADVMTDLHSACKRITLRNMRLVSDLATLADALTAAGIPLIVLKGAHLALAFYADPGLREMVDVDVLVNRHDISRAFDVAQQLGYSPRRNPMDPDGRPANHLPRLFKLGTPALELHWNIALGDQAKGLDLDHLWARAVPLMVAGTETRALSTEDLILHLCVHASYQHRFDFGLRPYCDLTTIMNHGDAEIDWTQVIARAREREWEKGVYLTLRLARELTGAQVPDEVLTSTGPAGFDEQLMGFARTEILSPLKDYVSPRIARLAVTAGVGSRMTHLWRRAFPAKQTIELEYGLPTGSKRAIWYYPVLFQDLARRHAGLLLRLLVVKEPQAVEAAQRRHQLRAWLDE